MAGTRKPLLPRAYCLPKFVSEGAGSRDYREGIRNLKEKRPPVFTGV